MDGLMASFSVFTIFTGAGCIQDQRVMHHIEMQDILDRALNILNTRITKFNHFVAIRANQMIMLFVTV